MIVVSPTPSGNSVVTVVQAAESRPDDKFAVIQGWSSTVGRALAESDVGPIVVIVRDVLGEHSLQMALIEHNHVIEKLTATASDPALSHSILPRTSNRGSHRHYFH